MALRLGSLPSSDTRTHTHTHLHFCSEGAGDASPPSPPPPARHGRAGAAASEFHPSQLSPSLLPTGAAGVLAGKTPSCRNFSEPSPLICKHHGPPAASEVLLRERIFSAGSRETVNFRRGLSPVATGKARCSPVWGAEMTQGAVCAAWMEEGMEDAEIYS